MTRRNQNTKTSQKWFTKLFNVHWNILELRTHYKKNERRPSGSISNSFNLLLIILPNHLVLQKNAFPTARPPCIIIISLHKYSRSYKRRSIIIKMYSLYLQYIGKMSGKSMFSVVILNLVCFCLGINFRKWKTRLFINDNGYVC